MTTSHLDDYEVVYIAHYQDRSTEFKLGTESMAMVLAEAAVDEAITYGVEVELPSKDVIMSAAGAGLLMAGMIDGGSMDALGELVGSWDTGFDFFQVYGEVRRDGMVLFRSPEAIGSLIVVDGEEGVGCDVGQLNPAALVDPTNSAVLTEEQQEKLRSYFPAAEVIDEAWRLLDEQTKAEVGVTSLGLTLGLATYIESINQSIQDRLGDDPFGPLEG